MRDLLILILLFSTGGFIGASEQGHISLIQCGMLSMAALAFLFLINKADKPIKKVSTMALAESNRQYRQLQYIINEQKKTTNL